jgi:hypothetical protein
MDTKIPRRRRVTTFRRAGWLAVAALTTAALFATPGVVLGHHSLPSATFPCVGDITWHVDDWTTDNYNNRALADHLEVWYSLDGLLPYVYIGDFHFDASNYLTGFGGSFSGGSATTVKIKVNLKAGTQWGDGDTQSEIGRAHV